MWLLIAFLAVPLIEIALFIQVGGAIGLWPTLLIVVITAILGTYLVRQQGLMALGQLQSRLGQLSDPTEPLAHGAMILFSGALLLTPGFFTDAMGFALLVPAVREYVFKSVRSRVKVQSFGPHGQSMRRDETIIEGQFEEVDPEPRRHQGPSGWTKDDGSH
ncbi:FxsA family protein [Aliishimia ponticola]|uniref:FxsA family protein n=1 Tax=Aliishimia ponticola TaxID=2499833 RepID=A0A4S4N6G0_9RHOB|nr:FxsA family protein [Aliishimia ponticola]THH34639.1 FxsA family protein [Aliishimia ponticola]